MSARSSAARTVAPKGTLFKGRADKVQSLAFRDPSSTGPSQGACKTRAFVTPVSLYPEPWAKLFAAQEIDDLVYRPQ